MTHQESLGMRSAAAGAAVMLLIVLAGSGIVAAPAHPLGIAAETEDTAAMQDTNPNPPNTNAQPAEQTQVGWIIVTTTDAARVFTPQTLRGVTFEKVQVTANAMFLLREQRSGGVSSCVAGACAETGDFDLVFFRERGDGTAVVVARHSNVGDEEGRVPLTANFGLVFLRTPTAQQDARGSGFVYLESHPGGGTLPDWR